MVTTWNSRCGIAENSRYIIEHLGKQIEPIVLANRHVEPLDTVAEEDIRRIWESRWSPDLTELTEAVDEMQADLVHVHFNFVFFELHHLADFIAAESYAPPGR